MKKNLIRNSNDKTWYYENGEKIFGIPFKIYGDVSGISGDVSKIRGSINGLSGECH